MRHLAVGSSRGAKIRSVAGQGPAVRRLAVGSSRGSRIRWVAVGGPARRLRPLAAAAALVVVLPGCACGWWRPESDRSLRMVEEAFLGRIASDAEATRRNVEGVPGWFEKEFRDAGPNLRTTFELYTDCPEGALPPGR